MKYRKKPVVVEANQWQKRGDHPKVIQFNPDRSNGRDVCRKCEKSVNQHGWVQTLEGGHIVCPGDWIITGVQGEYYPVKDDIFTKTYEPVK